ncbi:hypothetical protein D3C86_1855440 [compost metagenome]
MLPFAASGNKQWQAWEHRQAGMMQCYAPLIKKHRAVGLTATQPFGWAAVRVWIPPRMCDAMVSRQFTLALVHPTPGNEALAKHASAARHHSFRHGTDHHGRRAAAHRDVQSRGGACFSV